MVFLKKIFFLFLLYFPLPFIPLYPLPPLSFKTEFYAQDRMLTNYGVRSCAWKGSDMYVSYTNPLNGFKIMYIPSGETWELPTDCQF